MDRVILGKDPVLVDSHVSGSMGYSPQAIKHLDIAARCGVGSPETAVARIREFGKPRFRRIPDRDNGRLQPLRVHIYERQACSACCGGTIYALRRLEESGEPGEPGHRICIGQGRRNTRSTGLGIGACTRGFSKYLEGCPPTAREIYEFLAATIEDRTGA